LLYRKEAKNKATIRKYTPDYRPTVLDTLRADYWGVLAGIGLFTLMFGWAWGLGLYIGQAVIYIFLNSSINSLCHIVGYRNFNNQATNITVISWLTGGEGLHNNHHEYPTSARFSMRRGEFDPAWYVIRALETAGLAKVNRTAIAKAA
jgi:stearoyl-CoA desaturase (delta-9 desaturase)